MVLYNEWRLKFNYRPMNLSKEACYRYECLIKYKKLREKGFSEKEALDFLNLKSNKEFKHTEIDETIIKIEQYNGFKYNPKKANAPLAIGIIIKL